MRRTLLLAILTAVSFAAAPPAHAGQVLVSWKCNGVASCGGWFTTNVQLVWDVQPPAAIVGQTCQPATIDGDTPGTDKYCTVQEDNAVKVTYTATIKRDATPPVLTDAVPDRPPDFAGWYTHPVTFSVTGKDDLSGLVGCGAPGYGGPDATVTTVMATCRDVAGNIASRALQLRYDATAPDVSAASLRTGDRVVRLNWPAGADAKLVRTPGTSGSSSAVLYDGSGGGLTDRRVRNGRKYRYVLTLTDQAGNAASRELAARPDRHLLTPAKRAAVAGAPRLTWTPVRGARYYNVQLFRNGRKILSKWPRQASLQLKPKWRFHGKRYRLKPAKYRWYVWPGEGPREQNRYGRMVGKRSFTVAPA